MANGSILASRATRLPSATARNHEGAPALPFGDRHALAQLAATGTFGGSSARTPSRSSRAPSSSPNTPNPCSWPRPPSIRASGAT